MKMLFVFLSFALVSAKPMQVVDVSADQLPVGLNKNTMDVVSADIDGDSDNDLVAACEFCPNIILVNDGSGKFTNESVQRLPQVVHDSEDIAAEDFDGDGDIDLLFVSEDDFVNEYYLNDGKGFFTDASARIPVQGKSNAVCAVDVDKDGDKDVVIGNEGQDNLLLNDGKGNFTNATASLLPVDADVTQDIKAFDADKDGDLDLVFGNEDEGKLYFNNGKGKFSAGGSLPAIVSTVETRKVQVHDMDADGDLDLLFCNVAFKPGRSKTNLILFNDGKGNFSDATAKWYKGSNDYHSLDAQFVNLDNDGRLDLVVSNGFGARLQYFVSRKDHFEEVDESTLPIFDKVDVISLLAFSPSNKKERYLYLGVFRGRDKLLKIQ